MQGATLSDPDVAARKLLELANAVEPVQDGRIYGEKINWPFLYQLKSTPADYKAALERAIANGCQFLPHVARMPGRSGAPTLIE